MIKILILNTDLMVPVRDFTFYVLVGRAGHAARPQFRGHPAAPAFPSRPPEVGTASDSD